jgi:PAT family beta-lactamase induction signal transducer AmpG
MRRRTWLLCGSVAAGALMATAFHMGRLDSRGAMVLMFAAACCTQLVVSSCGGMMGALRVERSKRVACSFYQGGGLGFGAAAVFVLVSRVETLSRPALGLLAAALIAVPGLFALAAPKQEVIADHAFVKTMRRIWTEFKSTFLRWAAIPYTLLMIFPLASGAAVGLLPGVARDYGVNGQHVAWVNGLGVAYLTLALVNSGTLGVLWLGPLRPSTYYLGLMLYLFTIGTCYAMFTAVVLEFMGHSGKSGSGRYSIINSLGNVPVVYMIAVDGWGGGKWGARGLAGTEAVVGAIGALILLAYFLMRKQSKAAAEGAGVEV